MKFVVDVQQISDPFAPSGHLDECEDLLNSPIWKIAVFRLNGWGRIPHAATEQAWRPWHRFRWLDRGERLFGRRDR